MMQMAMAKVMSSDDGQVILLPDEFRLDTDEVLITKSGDGLILTPRRKTWEGFAEGLTGFLDDCSVTVG